MKTKLTIIAIAVLAFFATAHAQIAFDKESFSYDANNVYHAGFVHAPASGSGVYLFNSATGKEECFSLGIGIVLDQSTHSIEVDLSIFPTVALSGDYNDLINKPSLTKGDTGATGPEGVAGTNGVDGKQGSQGVAGPTGPKGTKGDTGPQGPAGATYIPIGANGSFTTADGKTITVVNGLITSIQ